MSDSHLRSISECVELRRIILAAALSTVFQIYVAGLSVF